MRVLIVILCLLSFTTTLPAFQKLFSKTLSLKLKDLLADMNSKNVNRHQQMSNGYKNNGKNSNNFLNIILEAIIFSI